MGKNLSPSLRRELRNLDKDSESRKSAMKSLKSYIKDLDSNAIHDFLEQVSETKEPGSFHGEYTISLFELLARVHGPDVVPQIDNIMETIIKTLSSSTGQFPLQQACSKVASAIARYGIQPTTPESNKREIIHSLSKPLADALLASQESLSSGAALCLKLLVDSDNWRYASSDTVNQVCLNVTGALQDKPLQTSSHMGLVMSLAKHNPLIIEAYSRMLLHAGLRIPKAEGLQSNHQQRLNAIQMINFLMRSLDPRNIYSELEYIISVMEKCQHDQMGYVRGAAFEALQTANKIMRESGARVHKKLVSHERNKDFNSLQSGRDQYPACTSPESQKLDFFSEYDSTVGSSSPASYVSSTYNNEQHGARRKHWVFENGCVDVSLQDGILGNMVNAVPISESSLEMPNGLQDHVGNEISGQPINTILNSMNSNSAEQNGDFITPRRLIHSLQDPIDGPCDASIKQRRLGGTYTRRDMLCSKETYDRGDVSSIMNGHSGIYGDSLRQESVSSTDDIIQNSLEEIGDKSGKAERVETRKRTGGSGGYSGFNVFLALFVVVAAFMAAILWFGGSECCNLVPT